MVKGIIFAVICLLLGAFLGNSIARLTSQRHQHTRSVMGLAQFHLDRLAAAAGAGQCQAVNQERQRLGNVYEELLQAFPLAYEQDSQFRSRADALRDAVQHISIDASGCATAGADEKKVRDACDACHRDYR
jgi:cytochrome c556